MLPPTVAKRLCEKVDKTSSKIICNGTRCHEWTGYTMRTGYGQMTGGGKTYYTHRVAWELANGPIPDGQSVLHRCDNRRCVNPDHLFLGTLQDNMDDMTAKGRQARGSRARHAKLTEYDVLQIRASDDLQAALAERYGVTQGVISMIQSGKIWRHV